MQPTAASVPVLSRYLTIPGAQQPIDLHLPADLAALREAALAFHTRTGTDMPPIPELLLSDAAAWQLHTSAEHWLVWRARMVAARLAALPVELDPGERIVGRPRFRRPTEAEGPALEAARAVLASMPPFPGGDAGHLHPDFDKLFAVGLDGRKSRDCRTRGRNCGHGRGRCRESSLLCRLPDCAGRHVGVYPQRRGRVLGSGRRYE